MSEHGKHRRHQSPIKTPQQLITVVVAAFVVPIIGILVSLITGGKGIDKTQPAMSPEAIAARIKPVGEAMVADANARKVEKTGREIVTGVYGESNG